MKNKANNVYMVHFALPLDSSFEPNLSITFIMNPIIFCQMREGKTKVRDVMLKLQPLILPYILSVFIYLFLPKVSCKSFGMAHQSEGFNVKQWFHEHFHIPESIVPCIVMHL